MLDRPLFIGAMGRIEGLRPWDETNPGEDFDFSSIRSTIYIFGLVFVVLFVSWHFARAWLTLPGVYLISGVGEDAKPPEKNPQNLLGEWFLVMNRTVCWCLNHRCQPELGK